MLKQMKFSLTSFFIFLSITGVAVLSAPTAVHSQTVTIRDAHLRATVATALGKTARTPLTQADMLTLRTLNATGVKTRDLTGLQTATNLQILNLSNTDVSDLMLLAKLTNLKTLVLANTNISDITPLVENMGLVGVEDKVDLRGCLLSYAAINTHIPALKNRKVIVRFDRRTPTTLLKISGDNQKGKPNASLKNPFVIEVQDQNNKPFEGVPITFTIITGDGTLTTTTTKTDANGRGQAILTLGRTFETYTVQATAKNIKQPVSFAPPVTIRDANLRAAIEKALGKKLGALITPADMKTLTILDTRRANIHNLAGLQTATNLQTLLLNDTSVSDITPLKKLTNLEFLNLAYTPVSDITSLATLTNLVELDLAHTPVSDITPLVANTGLGIGDTVNLTQCLLSYPTVNRHIPILQARGVEVFLDPLTSTRLLKASGENQNSNPRATRAPSVGQVQNPRRVPLSFLFVKIPDAFLLAKIKEALGEGPWNTRKELGSRILANEMEGLRRLNANNTNISNLTGLETATNLWFLHLNHTNVRDLTPLKGLTKLWTLDLDNTKVSDITPLVQNTGLGIANTVNLRGCLLNYHALNTDIPALQKRLVIVNFDSRTPTTLLKISGDNQNGTRNTALKNPFVVEVRDQNKKPFEGIPITFTLTTGTGTLGTTNTHTDSMGRAQTTFTLGTSIGTYIVQAKAAGIAQPINFHATVPGKTVIIPDALLRAKVATALGKTTSATITEADMLTLITLNANGVKISNLTGLETATNLQTLNLGATDVSDITPLKKLTQLEQLHLNATDVSDITPLVANSGLGTGDSVDLRGCVLSYSAINTDVPALQKRGVIVRFDSRTPTTLLKISGDNQNGTRSTPLENPFVVEVRDQNNKLFKGVPITFTVTTGTGTLGTTNTHTDSNGSAQTTFTLSTSIGIYIVQAKATGIAQSINFRATVPGDTVTFPDALLQAAVETALGKTTGATITEADMLTLTTLNANRVKIQNLTGLETATNLQTLNLGATNVSSLTPLQNLTKLEQLYLNHTRVSDITPLRQLTQLEQLYLNATDVSDITPLQKLTQLEQLYLIRTRVSDITPLQKLTQLEQLYLTGTPVSDIAPLVTNTGLGTGDSVDLRGCVLSYSAINTDIPALQERGVEVFFSSRTPTTLLKISGDNQNGDADTTLENPFVVEVQDQNEKPFEGVPITFTLTTGTGTLGTTNTHTDSKGRAQTTLTFGATLGAYITQAVAENITQVVSFTATVIDTTIPTAILTTPKETQNGAAFDVTITFSEPVTGFNTNDITLTTTHTHGGGQATLTSLTGSDARYTATITPPPTAEGTITLSVHKNAVTDGTNTGPATQQTSPAIQFDSKPPTVAFTAPKETQNSVAFDVIITFSEPVTGFDTNDITLTTTHTRGTAEAAFSLRSLDTLLREEIEREGTLNREYIATITPPIDAEGTITLTIHRDSVTDRTNTGPPTRQTSAAVQFFTLKTDVDGDGDVDVDDLVEVASHFGETGLFNKSDINQDGKVNWADLLAVINVLKTDSNANAAPALARTAAENLQQWITLAKQRNRPEASYSRGIGILEQFLETLLIPKETSLLFNYPNPFNPETWIPYELAIGTSVALRIYDVKGRVVRTLHLGHQAAGTYKHKSRAAYWDGRNEVGEPVASGVYFYTLLAGEFTATGKMIIQK